MMRLRLTSSLFSAVANNMISDRSIQLNQKQKLSTFLKDNSLSFEMHIVSLSLTTEAALEFSPVWDITKFKNSFC